VVAMNTFRGLRASGRLLALLRDDAGAALLAVLMFGAGLVIVGTAVTSRSAAQFGTTESHVCWEEGLALGEAALNWGTARVDGDPDYHTAPASLDDAYGTPGERAAVIAIADEAEGLHVLAFPGGGEGVFLRSDGSNALYGVGYCPGRDAPDRRVRVVRATTTTLAGQSGVWTATFAFLTDGDLEISGNPEFGDPEFLGYNSSVHANGNGYIQGNVKFFNGCVTWSAGGGEVQGNVNIDYTECPGPDPTVQFPVPMSEQPVVPVPPVVPREVWFKSQYDMCPGGEVRAGPAHPTLGGTAAEEPCTGDVLGSATGGQGYLGWKFQGYDSSQGNQWKASGNNSFPSGSFYFYQGSVDVSGSHGSDTNPRQVIIVAEGTGSCGAVVGGDVDISGNAKFIPYTAPGVLETNQLLIMAGRDFTWTGTQSLLQSGMIMAHEQMMITGTKSAIGSFLAEDACDTPGSPVSKTFVSGNVTIMLDGPKVADWISGSGSGDDVILIVGWTEVR
jgi:hypothetical protein